MRCWGNEAVRQSNIQWNIGVNQVSYRRWSRHDSNIVGNPDTRLWDQWNPRDPLSTLLVRLLCVSGSFAFCTSDEPIPHVIWRKDGNTPWSEIIWMSFPERPATASDFTTIKSNPLDLVYCATTPLYRPLCFLLKRLRLFWSCDEAVPCSSWPNERNT